MIHTFRVLLADADAAARAELRELLAPERDFEVVGEAADCVAASEAVEALAPDVLFLAVQLPPKDGFDVLERAAPERLPTVVFLAEREAATLPVLAERSADYLLKPVEPEPLRMALRHLRRSLHAGGSPDRMERLLALLADPPGRAGPGHVRRLVVREGQRVGFVRVEEIIWIEAAGNYVRVHAEDGTHLLRTPLAELEQKLDPAAFARIHRSMMVNLARVEEVRRGPGGEHTVVVEGGRALKLSRGYRDRLDSIRAVERETR